MLQSTLTFLHGVGEVTGSNFLLQGLHESGTPSVKILVDCGLIQGGETARKVNREPFSFSPEEIDYLLVTHAHLDHIGRIPKLVRDGFRGEIISTHITRELAEIMFEDALSLLQEEATREGLPPLYESADVSKALALWRGVSYHEEISLKEKFSAYFKDAGHILGSAMIEIRRDGRKIVFTGDLGNSPSLLLNDTEAVTDAEYLVMESVYGDRNHEPQEARNTRFADLIRKALERGGTVVIPAFSLERTQNILYVLNNLVEEKMIPQVPVFVDSPLAIRVTEIYKRHKAEFNAVIKKEIQEGDDIFNFPKLTFTLTTKDSRAISHAKGPKIILAGSGMSAGGRVTKHEREYLPDRKNLILLVGYQTLGTLGRALEEKAKRVHILGEDVRVLAQVENIRGFSSHKDSDALIEFAAHNKEKAKQIFVVMGEPKASLFLTQRLRDYAELPAIYPKSDTPYQLEL